MRPHPFRPAAFATLIALGLAGSAAAQTHSAMPGHGAMAPAAGTPAARAPAAGALATGAATPSDHADMTAAMDRMNRDMMAPGAMTGDPDRDLVAMMLPHHQGAIDMARIYLRTGRDPAIRRMAQGIITDQEREIREMHAWQARHPAPAR